MYYLVVGGRGLAGPKWNNFILVRWYLRVQQITRSGRLLNDPILSIATKAHQRVVVSFDNLRSLVIWPCDVLNFFV